MKIVIWKCDGCGHEVKVPGVESLQATLVEVTTTVTNTKTYDLCVTCVDVMLANCNPETWPRCTQEAIR